MAPQGTELSTDLLTAQERLLLRRRQRQAERLASGLPIQTQGASLRSITPPKPCQSAVTHEDVATLPSHLGWESETVTSSLRASRRNFHDTVETAPDQSWLASLAPSASQNVVSPRANSTDGSIHLHPDLALGMLRQERTADGRIWLLLRYIDRQGQGWVSLEQAKEVLTDPASELRVCSWRQLRNLLAKGEETFWSRRNGRIWLRSVIKVAAALEVRQFTGPLVAVPSHIFTQSIGKVRAHLYATFHSGRTIQTKSGGERSMPIARETIKSLCHISRRTQRNYERIARVRSQRNYAIGPKTSASETHETAWHHGQAIFQLNDVKGHQGRPETSYLAWQLPNNYYGPHRQKGRGQQKRINRKLADLSMQGMTGNGEMPVEGEVLQHSQRFFGNGRLAAKAHRQRNGIYWSSLQTQMGVPSNRSRLWHHLPGRS